jgi:hypothetical protein
MVIPSGRASVSKTRDGWVLMAMSSRYRSYKRSYDLESSDECSWVEIPTADGPPLPTGKQYFPPDTNPDVITIFGC